MWGKAKGRCDERCGEMWGEVWAGAYLGEDCAMTGLMWGAGPN